MEVFISPSIMKDSFTGYINLVDSYFLSEFGLHHSMASLFLVSVEKSGVILMGLSLYVTC
jgi:hypothetical protein